MRFMKLLLSYLFIISCFCCCGQSEWQKSLNEQKHLGEAMQLSQLVNVDSTKKAIAILNNLIENDSNYIGAYYFKFTCQTQLKQFDSAIITWNKMLSSDPKNIFSLSQGGLLYYRIGDTISANKLFRQSLRIGQKEIDTMNIHNKKYDGILMNNASNLVMLNKQDEANFIFEKMAASQPDSAFKNYFLTFTKFSKEGYRKLFYLQNGFAKSSFN